MPSDRIPQPSRHKATGQAVVRLNGKDHYLGRYGSAEAKAAYERLIAQWLAHGRMLPQTEDELSVNEVILAYDRFAEGYYKPGTGTTTGELRCIRDALRPVKQLFGKTSAAEFGPKKLKAVRQKMLDLGWCRSYVNHQVNRIKRLFKWAVGEELLPAEVFHALQAVPGLRRGMANVREASPIGPVPDAFVTAALPYMPPAVATMVQLQLLTGCRPGEICRVRTCDLDVSGKIWTYCPRSHKTQHHGHERVIVLGPKAQELLRPWLRKELEAYVFSPAASEKARNAGRKLRRQTPLTPSQARRKRKQRRSRAWGERYTRQSYARAIARACEKVDRVAHEQDPSIPEEQVIVPVWTPNQLRHTRATQLRREFGLEAAKVIMGHSTIETSQIYAERDMAAAAAVMEKIG